MKIFPLRTEDDYERALERAGKLMNAKKGTEDADELEILAILIEEYENEKFPIDAPDPVAAIQFRLEQMGKTQKDLSNLIGANRASEILNKKREISKESAIKIHHAYGIPYENLFGKLKEEPLKRQSK